jgi:stage V sporulation protein D (sporulation-specific penicillin-binding protein)
MNYRPRTLILAVLLYIGFFAILTRLFFWQIIKGDSLQAIAQSQYQRTLAFSGERGDILTNDGYTLATNQTVYRLFVNPQDVTETESIATQLAPILEAYYARNQEWHDQMVSLVENKTEPLQSSATDSAITESNESSEESETSTSTPTELPTEDEVLKDQNVEEGNLEELLLERLNRTDRTWISLAARIDEQAKNEIEALNIHGLGFDTYTIRSYPERDLAAAILGFVGKNEHGEDLGYFGVEGGLNNELKNRHTQTRFDTGLFGFQLFQTGSQPQGIDGREVTLSIRRDVQNILETELSNGMKRYGAIEGEIIVLEPKTGKIIGIATFPHYHPALFYEFDSELYRNSAVSHVYEPGSTFKPLTVAAGIDAGVINADTECPRCDGPVQVAGYQIRTWNNEYIPNITMTEALEKSDNTAMVYIAQELGSEKLRSYIEQFGIGSQTTDDLQEDRDTPLPDRWGPVELATRSFGQGISMTSLQLTRAIAAIANNGLLMQTSILDSIYDPITGNTMEVEPRSIRQVISPEAAQQVTKMMVSAAEHGEAQWTASRTHTIAAKTGTAQIAVQGGYDPDKTIASYVGFSPANDPKYVMMVKLVEPSSSYWASETAAPLWHKVAQQLHLLLEIPPDKTTQ